MEINMGNTPDIVRADKTPYYQDILNYLKEFEKEIVRINVFELAGRIEMRVVFSKGKHEECYKIMKGLVGESKAIASKYDLNLDFVPLKWYDEGRLQMGPVLNVGQIECVFMPPENGELYIFRPRDHEKLLKKYGLPADGIPTEKRPLLIV